MLLTKGYVGNQEVSRIYLGNNLVWEKESPTGPNWEARFNLSYDGAVDDTVAGANIISPVPSSLIIPNPTPFGTILDTNGNEITGVSVQMTGANTRADVGETTPPSTPDANLYRQKWWSNGSWFVDFSGLDDNKRYTVQVVSYESGSTEGQVITTVTYRKGTSATNLFVISGDASNPNPNSYDFDDLNQIRHDELRSDGGAFRLLVQRNGSVARGTINYIVVREYDIVIDGVQTLRTAGTTSSPLPFIEYVPADTSTPKPAFIWLHGSGERGNGTTQLPNVMKYGPNLSVSMGTFKQDAYAFSPQINTSGYWYDNGQNLTDFISYITTNYNVDPARIYLIGYSDGASGIGIGVSAATTRQVAAGIAMSYDPAIWGDNADPDYESHFDINKIAAVPTWTFRNSGESVSWGGQPYTLQYILDGVAELNSINPGIAKFTQFNDFTHDYPQKVINSTGMGPMVDSNYDPFDQDIYSWLLSHTL